jgi:hypothetical protein
MENKPLVTADAPGSMTLTLATVPTGWPYSFQWSGVTRNIVADIGRYPVLMAYVPEVGPGSYAHLEVEDQSINTIPGRTDVDAFPHAAAVPRPAAPPAKRVARGTTITAPGLSVVDLGALWGPSARHMQIRLITGGKNEGASCTYSWVRFIRREDLPALKENPHAPILSHVVEAAPPAAAPVSLAPRRITVTLNGGFRTSPAPGQRLQLFIPTRSEAQPVVSLADNNGFPEVQAVYARPGRFRRLTGVYVDIVFVQPWAADRAVSVAFNVWQPGMSGSTMPLVLPRPGAVEATGFPR